MIDIHTHLLPGIDDGCSNSESTITHIKILAEAGVDKIFFTPHYMIPHYQNSRSKILPIISSIKDMLKKENIEIEVFPGAEYFIDSSPAETVKNNLLTLGDSSYVLIETMMQKMSADFLKNTYELQKAGYKIILAHPERYMDVIQNPDIAEDFIHHDIYLQLNAGSFIGYYGKHIEKTAYSLLHDGLVHFIASDNHGNHHESFQKIVYDMICENYSSDIAELLFVSNPMAIASGDKIKLFNNWRFKKEQNSLWKNLKEIFTGHE